MEATAAADPHPDVQDVLDEMADLDVLPLNQYGAEGAREVYMEMQPEVEGPQVGDVEDRTVPGYEPTDGPAVPVRIYRPEGDPTGRVAFYHGGGFVIGNLDSHDTVCRYLVRETGATVVAVDYRLAPEQPFPAALQDCYAATEWVAATDDVAGEGLAVMGDSAGGNLAAAVSLAARDLEGPTVDRQVLVYPATSRSDEWPSMEAFAEGYFLTEADMEWFHDCYLPDPMQEANPYANPLEARSLADLPPATVLTAGFDPLRDQGAAYADRLSAAGVPVRFRNYESMIHGFFTMLEGMAELDDAHEALGDVAADLADAFD